jgi:DNA-binding NtrC family response regulator
MSSARGHILIVDDNENMRALLRDILAPDHDVVLAADGPAARGELESQRFELVLTDVRMPGLDGFEIIRLVKERWPLTEVVMMTAFASVPAAVEAMRQGAYDYIEKPFDPDDVGLVVRRALGRHRERATTPSASSQASSPTVTSSPDEDLAALSYREALASARDRGSREYLSALLKAFEGNVSRAAERAGLERESLHRLLRRHGVQADAFRQSGNDDG